MARERWDRTSSKAVPWSAEPKQLVDSVRQVFSCDAMAVAVLGQPRPQPDEWLAVHGIPAAVVTKWCRTGARHDPLLRAAMRQGTATLIPTDAGSGSELIRGRHALMSTIVESVKDKRWWWLLVTRTGEPFNPQEQLAATLLLRRWQVAFHSVVNGGLGRLLIGHDARPLVVDIDTQTHLLGRPQMIKQLESMVRSVVTQRWPNLREGMDCDVALRLNGESYWVIVRHASAIDAPNSEHWYLELWPLATDDLPTIALVEDDRIAQAIGYLHKNYPKSPSLAQIAQTVHMSSFHFHRLFSTQVGMSPKQYLQCKQLQAAKWMLRTTRAPIGAIAERTGFANHGHFTSTFHRAVGIKPSQFREQE